MRDTAGNVYALYIDLERCVDYRFDAYGEMDYWDDFLAHSFRGKPLAADWRLPKHAVGHTKCALNDFVQGYTEAPFISRRAKHALMPILQDEAEFRSIGAIVGRHYYVMNVVNVVDCLDEGASEIVRAEDGRVLSLRQARFIPDRLPHATVFKVPQDTGRIYVTERFINAVRSHHLTGVGFEPADKVGLSMINNAFPDLPIRVATGRMRRADPPSKAR